MRLRVYVDPTGALPDTVEVGSTNDVRSGALASAADSGLIEYIGPAIRRRPKLGNPVTRHELTVERIDAWLA